MNYELSHIRENLYMNIHFFKRAALLAVAAGFILAVGCNQNVTTPQQQKGSTLTITLTQSPAKETKTNGAVTVTVASSTSIKEAKWQEGDHKTKDVFANGTVISGKIVLRLIRTVHIPWQCGIMTDGVR